MNSFIQTLRPVITLLILSTLIFGIAYPLGMTSVAKLLFPHQAEGSLIVRDEKAVGSELVGQKFTDPAYFWGRPTATATVPYNAAASGGSNLSIANPAQLDAITDRMKALHEAAPTNKAPIPVDLVTASASGLDPHISPAAARYQANRIAKARHIKRREVYDLINENMEPRTFGILGEPRVNVLKLNLALDQKKTK